MTFFLARRSDPSRLWRGVCAFVLLAVTGCGADQPDGPKRAEKPVIVTALTVRTEPLAQTVVRSGTLRARRVVRLHSQEEGRIEALPVFEGDRVEAGALLVRLDDRLLQAELRKAAADRRQAEQDIARLRRLADRKLVSEDELLRAETSLSRAEAEASLLQTRLGYTTITAPFAGVVSERRMEPGDAVPRFAHLLTLIDPESLITEVSVSELILPTLEIGAQVDVRIDALGDKRYAGRIERLHPTVDPSTRLGTVEIALEPVPPGAQAGQLCRVYLPGEVGERRVIPLAALRRDSEGEYVLTIDKDDTARRTPVISGAAFGNRIEIVEGLADGDRVITRGFIEVIPGKSVTVAEERPADRASSP